ncbi:MAG TPA: helix-turn-helix domain-containing protein [Methanoregulaceae archaeon]|nr:helix-turn-helix domain-containing protein [Methanoregulaceae archaeon]
MADDGLQKFYTIEEAAALTGYSVRRLRDFVRDGTLEAERWGREYRISTPSLQAFIEARRKAEIPERQRPGAGVGPRTEDDPDR